MNLAFDPTIEHNSPEAQRTICKVLEKIQSLWDFTNLEMAHLLHVRANTYGNWINNKKVPIGALPLTLEAEAIIAVIAIHRSLSALFQNPADQILWLRSPHPDFNQKSPMEHAVQSSAGLFYLRNYLDFIRGQ